MSYPQGVIPLGTAAGLGAAGCFGVGDFLAQRVTRDVGWLRTMLWLQICSVPLLVVLGAIWTGLPATSLADVGWIALLGVANTLGSIGLYRAFEVGKLSVVSPIVGSFGAVTVLLSIVAGNAPPLGLWPGIVALLLGVVLSSATQEESQTGGALRPALGVGWALLSAVGFGTAFWGVELLVHDLGAAWPVAGLRTVGIPVLLAMALLRGDRLGPPRATWRPALASAVLDTAGMVVYTFGTSLAHVGLVAVLSSLFSGVTVALAQLWLGERLRWWQWVGVVAILGGVAWVVGHPT
jgi:drug/metabolite transporter (DMT)-like permease